MNTLTKLSEQFSINTITNAKCTNNDVKYQLRISQGASKGIHLTPSLLCGAICPEITAVASVTKDICKGKVTDPIKCTVINNY